MSFLKSWLFIMSAELFSDILAWPRSHGGWGPIFTAVGAYICVRAYSPEFFTITTPKEGS